MLEERLFTQKLLESEQMLHRIVSQSVAGRAVFQNMDHKNYDQ